MNIAIIPARGGSKRIPRKNIKEFHGKPMIAYSIESALESNLFSEVYVSTDDEEITEIATKYGAKVSFKRPVYLSDDHTATVPVVKHAITEVVKTNETVELVCCIYATAPFIQRSTLIKAYDLILGSKYDFCFPVTEFDYAIQRALVMQKDSQVSMLDSSQYNIRSQDLEVYYHDVGQFYFGRKDAWLKEKPIFSSNSIAMPIPRKFAQDIDTPEDWEIAEHLYKLVNG